MVRGIIVCDDKTLEDFKVPEGTHNSRVLGSLVQYMRRDGACFSRLAKKYEGRATFSKLSMRENEESPKRYQVYITPTFIFFRDGKEIKRMGGHLGSNELDRAIEGLLKNPSP